MISKKTPNPVDVAVGANVRRFRMMRGMSQERLGELAGSITFQQVQKYEKGVNRIGSSRLQQIASVLEVSISDLFAGTENGPNAVVPSMIDEQIKAAKIMLDIKPHMRSVAIGVLRQLAAA